MKLDSRNSASRWGRATLLWDMGIFLMLSGVALGIGILLNHLRESPAPLVYQSKAERMKLAVERIERTKPVATNAPTAPKVIAPPETELPDSLSLIQLRQIVDEKQIPVLDARPEILHRMGHIPGALALPRNEFDVYYAKIESQLQPKTRPLVIYCSGTYCEDSKLVEKALRNLGHTHLSIYRGGWTEWSQAQLPVEKQ